MSHLSNRRVVVTGMGCITPIGHDVDTFFRNLLDGVHGFGPITKFDASDLKVSVVAEVKDFDPTVYMDKSEVKKTDLYAQYAIAAARQAVNSSGILGTVDPSRLGVYVGSGIGGIQTIMSEAKKLFDKGPSRISPFMIPMMISNMAAALIAIAHQAQGPCLPVVTACATATHAIGEAFRAIKHGYADAIIAGGAEAAIHPISIGGFTSAMALTTATDPDRASIPFDAERSGFVMGEGSGILVLEEYERAVARGATIYAEISGYGNSCDAHHITAPQPEAIGVIRMLREAVEESGIVPDRNLYFNPHGTSTPLNDKTETLAIKTLLSAYDASLPHDVLISSTKSMTGHLLGAAGGIEAIASIQTLRTGKVHPTCGYRVADPECDLNYVTQGSVERPIDKAITMSLGFGGHNACLVFRKIDG